MIKFDKVGQGYFDFSMPESDFQSLLSTWSYMDCEKFVRESMKKRVALLDEMKSLGLKGFDWFKSDLHSQVIDISNKISLALVEMNYRAWEV